MSVNSTDQRVLFPAFSPIQTAKGTSLIKQILPWLVSAFLLYWVFSTHDVSAIVNALGKVSWPLLVGGWLLYALATLFCEAFFLQKLVGYAGGKAPFRQFVAMRAATYLLSAVHAAVGGSALVLWFRQRFQMSTLKAGAIFGLEVVFELGTFGFLGLLAAVLISSIFPTSSISLVTLVTFGWVAIAICGSICLATWLAPHLLPPKWVQVPLRAPHFAHLFGIKIIQNVVHGIYISVLLWSFGLMIPLLEGIGMAQIIRSARGVPIAIFGAGVDQLTFEALFSSFPADILIACSLVYTGSMIIARLLPGVICLRYALNCWSVDEPE